MFFVALHKPYRGQVDEVMIRADLILEVSTRRHTSKAAEYAPPEDATEKGAETGAWLLIDRMGWTPCVETPSEVAEALITAEVEYRRRLAAPQT